MLLNKNKKKIYLNNKNFPDKHSTLGTVFDLKLNILYSKLTALTTC